jgi:hemolysin III
VIDSGQRVVARPLLRGVSHQVAFFLSVGAGAVLIAGAQTTRGQIAAAAFATTIACMFGASALYHRVRWSPAARRWMRRVDHAAIFLVIAGGYTAYGVIVLDGAWRVAILSVVLAGVLTAIVLRFVWVTAPGWVAAGIGIGLGWLSVLVLPQIVQGVGIGGFVLLLAGGVLYTAGALVYALERPDPFPAVFGYHEVFHALVIAAVVCQYASVAFFLLPAH